MPSETLFPHLTSTASAPTYREVASTYRNVLATRYAEGTLRPLVLPYHLYGGFLLMAYLCIPHTRSPIVYAARWPVLAVIIWFEWTTVQKTSSQSPAIALAAGLTSSWGVVWSITWLVLRRPQWDARRVQRRKKRRCENGNPGEQEPSEGIRQGNDRLRYRASVNSRHESDGTNGQAQFTSSEKVVSHSVDEEADIEYYWQPCPESLRERIPWVMDLIMNFRGPGWNWAISPLPDLPQFIKAKLGDSNLKPTGSVSSFGLQQYTTRRQLFHARVIELVAGYLILDIVKVIMMKDPYYIFGPTTYALPSHLASLSQLQLGLYRETLNAITIVVSLRMAFVLMPFWMCLLNGPRVFGLRAEPWYFPSSWGSFSNILDKGLSGLWGRWWHQTFRFAFSAPSNFLIDNGYVEAKSATAKLSALVFAFGISGFMHRWGSLTQFPETHAWDPPIFFMLQGLGIFIQTTLVSIISCRIETFPKAVKQVGNLIFTLIWVYGTAWILVDDFSRGGIWLYEPIPISPLRGLGFGVEGDGWWCWDHIGVSWYTGKHWWESGIAL